MPPKKKKTTSSKSSSKEESSPPSQSSSNDTEQLLDSTETITFKDVVEETLEVEKWETQDFFLEMVRVAFPLQKGIEGKHPQLIKLWNQIVATSKEVDDYMFPCGKKGNLRKTTGIPKTSTSPKTDAVESFFNEIIVEHQKEIEMLFKTEEETSEKKRKANEELIKNTVLEEDIKLKKIKQEVDSDDSDSDDVEVVTPKKVKVKEEIQESIDAYHKKVEAIPLPPRKKVPQSPLFKQKMKQIAEVGARIQEKNKLNEIKKRERAYEEESIDEDSDCDDCDVIELDSDSDLPPQVKMMKEFIESIKLDVSKNDPSMTKSNGVIKKYTDTMKFDKERILKEIEEITEEKNKIVKQYDDVLHTLAQEMELKVNQVQTTEVQCQELIKIKLEEVKEAKKKRTESIASEFTKLFNKKE